VPVAKDLKPDFDIYKALLSCSVLSLCIMPRRIMVAILQGSPAASREFNEEAWDDPTDAMMGYNRDHI